MLRPFLILSLVLSATAALAAPAKLTGDELKAQLNGALVEMDTPLGTKIPVRFGTDGLVSGEAGELAALLGSEKDRGRWWIDGDRICSKWFRWFEAKPQCISVRQDGTRLFWKEDGGKTGTATLVEAAPQQNTAPAPPQTIVATKAESVGPASPVRPLPRSPDPVRASVLQPPVKTAQAAPLPFPIRGPHRKEAVRVAVVPPADVSGPQDSGSVVETASVVTAAVNTEGSRDLPIMRFGGAGLLEASSRLAGATSPSGETADTAPPARDETSKQVVSVKATSEKSEDGDVPVRVAEIPKPSQPAVPRRAKVEPPAAGRSVSVAASVRPTARSSARDVWTTGPSVRAPGRLYRVRGVERRDVLNVRRGPSEHHAAVAHIPPDGRRVKITGACVGDWCPVRYRRATGWVHSFYLAEEQPRGGSASQVYLAQP